jgi:ribonuclease HI
MTGKTICICSDSRAALLALSSASSSVIKFGHQCWYCSAGTLYMDFIHNMVQLFWVPDHSGIIGNEEADGLAGLGYKSNFCGPEPCMSVTMSLMTLVTKEWLSGNHLSD